MSELQAKYASQLATGSVEPGVIHTERSHPDLGELRLTRDGVVSSVYGSLDFLTPISELSFDKVTEEERVGYGQWRNNYQSNWRWAFDPIAARLVIADDRLEGDVSVMPLIWGTDYRMYVDMSRGAQINPSATDQHDALAHVAIALNRKSETVRGYMNFARNLAPGIGVDPLAWMGPTVSFYIDDTPFWERARSDPPQPDEFVEIPYTLVVENQDALKLAAFVAALRAFIEQSAPELTMWEAMKHSDEPYVKVSASEKARAESPDMPPLAVYYAPTSSALIVSTSEISLKRALDRRKAAGASTQPAAPTIQPWLGENLCAQVQRRMLDQAMSAFGVEAKSAIASHIRMRSWSNLAILNEWRGMFPDQDPVAVHQRLWRTKLVCPGGGKYVWNDAWQTMESTAFGHPGEPKMPDPAPTLLQGFSFFNFGLTFEEQGLRGRVSLHREPAR